MTAGVLGSNDPTFPLTNMTGNIKCHKFEAHCGVFHIGHGMNMCRVLGLLCAAHCIASGRGCLLPVTVGFS